MSKLLKLATFGLVGDDKKKKKKSEAEKAAKEVGAKIGKASPKAQAAHERDFGGKPATVLGGARSGFGSTGRNYSGIGPTGLPLVRTGVTPSGARASTPLSGGAGGASSTTRKKQRQTLTTTLRSITR